MPTDKIAAWRQAPDLGALFMQFWEYVQGLDPTTRHSCAPIEPNLNARLRAASYVADAAQALTQFIDHLEGPWRSAEDGSPERVGLAMGAMRVIDTVFLEIHPRSLLAPAGYVSSMPPEWLEDVAGERMLSGAYCRADATALIPKGPLCRATRYPDASYADALADQFSALVVVPTSTRENGRPISIKIEVIGTDPGTGVPPAGNVGSERVGFVPIAEAAGDLDLLDREHAGAYYLRVTPNSSINTAIRLHEGLKALGTADIALSPELTMPEAAADSLCKILGADSRPVPRIILTGSGETISTQHDCAWNEARLVNARGAPLLRQRKIWPFGMARQRSTDLSLVDPGPHGLLMEDVASGDTLSIVDLPEFGRCLILICQDFKTPPMVADTLRAYQPDWVFIPVLDVTIEDHGWCRQKAFALSEESQARFMVVNSLTLGQRISPAKSSPLGLVIGPTAPADSQDQSRASKFVQASATGPVRGEVTWRSSAGWSVTTIGSKAV